MKLVPALHVMDAELIQDRATVRYSCPTCERCVEDGPEGLRVLVRGDLQARHRGGNLFDVQQEVPAAEEPQPARVLH